MQNAFPTLKVLSLNSDTPCVSFYRLRKIVVFFLKPDLIPKLLLLKPKCFFTYPGINNGGKNGYCEQRLR